MQQLEKIIDNYFIDKKIAANVGETIKSDNFITFKINLYDITKINKFSKTMEKELSYLLGTNASVIIKDQLLITINNTEKKTTASYKGVTIPLGVDTFGQNVLVDFSKNPHWLCGGSTGSGKSVFLNNVINELLKNYKNVIEFMFIDLKQVEFAKYENLEQNILHVANTATEAIELLDAALYIMSSRYEKYKQKNVLNIADYNETQADNEKDRYLFVIIDELAELMLLDKDNVQDRLQRLLQLGRAAGVYVISATQRPDSNVLAGTLKVNYTTRICFRVSSVYDSKTIINQTGGELLAGNGDGLILQNGSSEVTRFQAFAPCNDDLLKENYTEKPPRETTQQTTQEQKASSTVKGSSIIRLLGTTATAASRVLKAIFK